MDDAPVVHAALDPVSGLELSVPTGWTARLGGPESARRLVLQAPDGGPAAGARLVAACVPGDEDVRIAAPAAATVLVTGQAGRTLDYTTWGGSSGRSILFSTDGTQPADPPRPQRPHDRADTAPGIGRVWLTCRQHMLTTITLLAPAASWAAAAEAADVALAGLRLPRTPAGPTLRPVATPPRLDPHLSAHGIDVEDLTALDAAQPRPLLGRRVDVPALDLLRRLPSLEGEAEPLTAAAPLIDLGLLGPGLRPTPTGLLAARLLGADGPAARVDVHDPTGTATAFVRVGGGHLLAVTSDATDPDEDDGPGLRAARALRLHLAPAAALPGVLAGLVRLGPAWALPMRPQVLDPAALAARWGDPAVPPPATGDPHLAAWWGQPWSLVTLRWTASGSAGSNAAAGANQDGGPIADEGGYEHAERLLRAGARGWVRLTAGPARVAAEIVPTGEVWHLLWRVAASLQVNEAP